MRILLILIFFVTITHSQKVQASEGYKTRITLAQGFILAQPSRQITVEVGEANIDKVRKPVAYRRLNIYTSCVEYAKSQGLPISGYGYARNYPTNSDTPQSGGFVKTNESWAGHLAKVESVNPDGTITLSETNYEGAYISTRTISATDGRISGFIN